MSGNSLMIIILSSASYIIQHIIKSAREKILFHECIDEVSMQHRKILEAIRTGNVVEIKKRMQEHMEFVSRSEEHTSELQSRQYIVCRLLLEKKKIFNSCWASSLVIDICE